MACTLVLEIFRYMVYTAYGVASPLCYEGRSTHSILQLLTNALLQKKKFDSADYFTEHEKLKKAAGLDGAGKKDGESGAHGEEHKEEAKK